MKQYGLRIGLICAAVARAAGVADAQAPRRGACGQIIAACQQAGFERGGAKGGNGIQIDCVRPIMQGTAQRRRAAKPLPQVAPELVAACSAANPNFGQRTRTAQPAAPGQAASPAEAPPAAQSLPPAAPGAPPSPN
jgi:hypothetical protein